MDALAEVLQTNRVTGSISFRSLLRSPWSIEIPPMESTGIFHFVLGGVCWLVMPGFERPLRLLQGDVVLLPHGGGHVVGDVPGQASVPLDDLIADCDFGPTAEFRFGGDGPATSLLSGGYHFDADVTHPVFAQLPPLIHVATPVGGEAMSDAQAGIQAALRLLTAELAARRSGYQAVIDRLVDVVFVYIVRFWVEAQPEGAQGWLAALRHPCIGRAISLLHGEPARPWTVGDLARAVGMSRSAFARDFKALTGEGPLTYLTGRRIEQAAQLLRQSDLSLAQIAQRTGYESEYSFGKAFKRTRGISPGRYRAGTA